LKLRIADCRALRRGVLLVVVPFALSAQTILSVGAQSQRVESIVVVRAAGLAVGDRLTRDNLQEAIRRIYATGLFARVESDTTLIADGVKVLFRARSLSGY
jgi:outer membrane protein assembly factor BamA